MPPKKREKKCVCGKHRHLSKGAAESQVRGLQKLQTLEFGKKDFKSINRLHVCRYRVCERAINDGFQVWHVGHR
jgi:hypothetical protein